ncbi:MAG: RsmE family RNA methyltransferase [Planctomycetota bacterium]
MRPRRFKAERLDEEVVTLCGAEVHHAVKVLRLGTGDSVILFDGGGGEAVGTILDVKPETLRVRVTARRVVPVHRNGLSMMVATPKGERADWMMEKCAELGVRAMTPLICARGQVSPGDGKLARWRRKAGEAAKQSGQSVTMRVDAPMVLSEALRSCAQDVVLLFGDPRADAATMMTALAQATRDASVVMLVGPEGGFAHDEIRMLEAAGAKSVRLAESILRVETAAVAGASVWAAWRTDIAGE